MASCRHRHQTTHTHTHTDRQTHNELTHTQRQRCEAGKRSMLDCSVHKALCVCCSTFICRPVLPLSVGGHTQERRPASRPGRLPLARKGTGGGWGGGSRIERLPRFPRRPRGEASEIIRQQEAGTARSRGRHVRRTCSCVCVCVCVRLCARERVCVRIFSEELASGTPVRCQTRSICPSQSVWAHGLPALTG